MKAHFYPFTGQVTPVAMEMLVSLGVPASTVGALRLQFDASVFENQTGASVSNRADRSKGGSRG